jgi:hypothetical protein
LQSAGPLASAYGFKLVCRQGSHIQMVALFLVDRLIRTPAIVGGKFRFHHNLAVDRGQRASAAKRAATAEEP